MEGLATIANLAGDLMGAILHTVRLLWPLKVCTLSDGERGLITFCGKYIRDIGPGLNWTTALCDFEYGQALGCYVDLAEQGLQTSDNTVCVVNGSAVYEMVSPKLALLMVEDVEVVVQSACMEGIRRYARQTPFDQMQDSANVTRKIRGEINKLLKEYGVRVNHVMIADLHPTDVQVACDTAAHAVREILRSIAGPRQG